MNYSEALDFLYRQMPVFQHKGSAAYKPGLERIKYLCQYLGNPQDTFKSIHVAGTNGKGSSAHMLASVLQSAGYQVGLHTSPHLHEFTERLRVSGQEAEKKWVAAFVTKHQSFLAGLNGSFFEIIVGMAFQYFAEQKVEWAVVEVGLGGRLDATNILSPEACLITHIGQDHEAILGDTLPKIAAEKAGIIKPNTPVIRSEKQTEVEGVFRRIANEKKSELFYADPATELKTDLEGAYQKQNLLGVLKTLEVLKTRKKITLRNENLKEGLLNVRKQTGLRGRWDILQENPRVIADVAHNVSGVKSVLQSLKNADQTHFILGFSADKNVAEILRLFPPESTFHFTTFSSPRAMPLDTLIEKAKNAGLTGNTYTDVNTALANALRQKAGEIWVLGSIFLIAELKASNFTL